MEKGMLELIEMILRTTQFIAIGGGLAIVFFFVFAPHITGSKLITKQLEQLEKQTKKLNENIEKLVNTKKQDDDK
ncbi:MAG: hypothetical protein KAS96_00690 [Planctomycetes bacterium]|nr:hypothetical protein [Planctomycetota bacterium]